MNRQLIAGLGVLVLAVAALTYTQWPRSHSNSVVFSPQQRLEMTCSAESGAALSDFNTAIVRLARGEDPTEPRAEAFGRMTAALHFCFQPDPGRNDLGTLLINVNDMGVQELQALTNQLRSGWERSTPGGSWRGVAPK
jgi:hypothetical protein